MVRAVLEGLRAHRVRLVLLEIPAHRRLPERPAVTVPQGQTASQAHRAIPARRVSLALSGRRDRPARRVLDRLTSNSPLR